jgi:hypothetical protein
VSTCLDHLLETLEDHIARLRIVVVDHCMLERFQKVLLELEARKFFLFQESDCKLPQRIEGKTADM